jgi:hypothetical protein
VPTDEELVTMSPSLGFQDILAAVKSLSLFQLRVFGTLADLGVI